MTTAPTPAQARNESDHESAEPAFTAPTKRAKIEADATDVSNRESTQCEGAPSQTNLQIPNNWQKKDISTAILWYYQDKEGKRQGPFYPGQMRQWFESGYFPPDQRLAPSFMGEVPRNFVHLNQLFPADVAQDKAFAAREDIALWPPAQAQSSRDEDDDDDQEKFVMSSQRPTRPQWLEDSIQRQKAGIKRKMIYGPVERENYN